VLFVAHLAKRGKDASFAELSSFAHDGTGIRYLAGHTFAAREVPRGTTIDALESR
jgi:SEC-C motif-containing protein